MIPANSFAPISGGWRFLSTNPGITQMRVMTNGTFLIQASKMDFTGTNPTAMGVFSFSVGVNTFSGTPNSQSVAKIIGPTNASVGSVVFLDGAQSSDFNGEPLTYAWAIVSQPQGSNISLSSTTNATTSFVPQMNGAYVLRLTTNDGLVNGVPALATVMVSGAPSAPAPNPGPNNGLISLSPNQTSYLVGESAVLGLHVDVSIGNSENRYFFRATFDDQPVALTTVTSGVDYSFTTEPFSAPGAHSFKVTQYVERVDLAIQLNAAITSFNNDIAAVNKALQYETDPAVIAKLQAQKAFDLEQISNSLDQLERNRTKVAETAVLGFSVN